jgi:heptosyltransferase-2
MTDKNIKKICVIRLGGFGDVILFLNAVKHKVRPLYPDAQIDFVVAKEFASLMEGCDFIDRAILHDRSKGLSGAVSFMRFCLMLKAEKYDLVLDLHNNTRSRIMGAISGAKRTIFDFPEDERGSGRLAEDEAVTSCKGVVFPGKRTPVWISDSDAAFICSLRSEPESVIVGLCLGGSWESKRWPNAHFIKLGNDLIEKLKATIVLIGGPLDVASADEVERALHGGKVINLAGKTSISRSIAATLICSAIVSADSGILHAAHLSGTPLVGLFGCTDHKKFGYSGTDAASISAGLSCSPCHKPVCPLGTVECMAAISPEQVYSCLETLI